MIHSRYIASHIYKGAALVLLILVSISVFINFNQQMDHLGKGTFGGLQMAQYLLLRVPSSMVDFIPLAALIGAILGLGQLAANSELIALHAAGLSLRRLMLAVLRAAIVLAIFAAVIAEYVAPYTETRAVRLKSSSIQANVSMESKTGIWIRDDNNIVYIDRLFPNGDAARIQIFELDANNQLLTHSLATSAALDESGWQLKNIRKTTLNREAIKSERVESAYYQGELSSNLLQSLVVDPAEMSARALNAYIVYLQANGLSYQAESLSFWKKIYAPLTVLVLSLLAIPFVMGSQRQGNAGQRLMIGIMLGLSFTVLNSVLIQLGEQISLWPPINAIIPTALFLLLTLMLIARKSSQS